MGAADELGGAVDALVRETAATVVLPSFKNLKSSEIMQKAPGELVTVADRRSEEMLARGLRELLPGSVVVGEEGVAADAGVLAAIAGEAPVWIVDPIDGTANFAGGRTPFCLMVALLRGATPVQSWIYDPVDDLMGYAAAGGGAFLDGVRVEPAPPLPADQLRGVASTSYLPADLRAKATAGAAPFGAVTDGQHCAGREYLDMAAGKQQFAMFWRSWPWDHLPGALLIREAGGVVRRFDGTDYVAAPDPGSGLLAATSAATWHLVADALL